jgi:hypothetical protein
VAAKQDSGPSEPELDLRIIRAQRVRCDQLLIPERGEAANCLDSHARVFITQRGGQHRSGIRPMEPTCSKSEAPTKRVGGIQQVAANPCKSIASDPPERRNEPVDALWQCLSNRRAVGERLHVGGFERHRSCGEDSCRPWIGELFENDSDPLPSRDDAAVQMRCEPIIDATEMPKCYVRRPNVIAPGRPCNREIGSVLTDNERDDLANGV